MSINIKELIQRIFSYTNIKTIIAGSISCNLFKKWLDTVYKSTCRPKGMNFVAAGYSANHYMDCTSFTDHTSGSYYPGITRIGEHNKGYKGFTLLKRISLFAQGKEYDLFFGYSHKNYVIYLFEVLECHGRLYLRRAIVRDLNQLETQFIDLFDITAKSKGEQGFLASISLLTASCYQIVANLPESSIDYYINGSSYSKYFLDYSRFPVFPNKSIYFDCSTKIADCLFMAANSDATCYFEPTKFPMGFVKTYCRVLCIELSKEPLINPDIIVREDDEDIENYVSVYYCEGISFMQRHKQLQN